jgi:phosphatidylserine/phosphatidylglycerophosphate/cardiolipin synthase-like enzyme
MKRVCLSSFFIVLLFFYNVHAFFVHQSEKFLKTYHSLSNRSISKLPKIVYRSSLYRPLRSPKRFLRRFFRFFSTSLIPLKQHVPIAFKTQTALFSTEVNLKNVLIGYLDQEKEKVSIAIYLLTDKDIANAIARMHKRGVQVEIVTDKKASESIHSQIPFLEKMGIPVFLYSCLKCAWSLMHHKFVLFFGQKLVWNGSFNFTKTASVSNQENVVLMRNKKVFKQFENAFLQIKQESMTTEKAPKN